MKLNILPRKTMTKEAFLTAYPDDRSITLDGFLHEPPFRHFTKSGGYLINFDHHTGGDRLSMRSTSGQVMMALKLGLADCIDNAQVFVNDCDQDVCLATWLLQHPHRVVRTSEPLLNRLVWAEDTLDATGGSYPFAESSDLRETLHWIFAPYENAAAKVSTIDENIMRSIIEAVWKRIDEYLMGLAGKVERPQSEFVFTPFLSNSTRHGLDGFLMIDEQQGLLARQTMARAGIRSFVSVKHHNAGPLTTNGNRWDYKIGSLAPFSFFPLLAIYDALNKEEAFKYMALGQPWSTTQGWGGSDLIGGGPRNGSLLPPKDVQAIVLKVMEGTTVTKEPR